MAQPWGRLGFPAPKVPVLDSPAHVQPESGETLPPFPFSLTPQGHRLHPRALCSQGGRSRIAQYSSLSEPPALLLAPAQSPLPALWPECPRPFSHLSSQLHSEGPGSHWGPAKGGPPVREADVTGSWGWDRGMGPRLLALGGGSWALRRAALSRGPHQLTLSSQAAEPLRQGLCHKVKVLPNFAWNPAGVLRQHKGGRKCGRWGGASEPMTSKSPRSTCPGAPSEQ